MNARPTLVFPGLDGTTHMLSRFAELAPPTHEVSLLDLPNDQFSYSELSDHFAGALNGTRKNVIITVEGSHLILQTRPREAWTKITDFTHGIML